jgi:hypothetical protein
MTALAGLPAYLDLAHAMRLSDAADHHLGVRRQGWTDGQLITALTMLNLAGGECVDDLKILEADHGFCRIMETCLTHGLNRKQRRELLRRWRKKRQRVCPSASSIFRYLNAFHRPEWDDKQVYGAAWVPRDLGLLAGFSAVNAEMLAFAQRNNPCKTATMDLDATLVETLKEDALCCYKGYRAYQPLNAWWAEQELFVHTEFRAGNVPAGFELKRFLDEALRLLPDGVERVRMRSDTAGYQHDLLRYCELAENERVGRVEFAVSCPVDAAFKRSVAAVPQGRWHTLHKIVKGRKIPTNRQWAEVWHVTDGAGTGKKSPIYRYIAIREPLQEQVTLPGVETRDDLPFPTMELACVKYKVHGLVSNMDWGGGDLVRWLHARCGKSEQAHTGLKSDLAGGKLPSGRFGANAAWWWITILAFNLNAMMKSLALGEEWKTSRLKAIRFGLINVAGRVLRRSRQWLIRLAEDHPALGQLLEARRKISLLIPVPT